MTRQDKILMIVVSVVMLITFSNYMITTNVKKEKAEQELLLQKAQARVKAKNERVSEVKAEKTVKKHKLVPEDPAKYGIVSMAEDKLPKTQMHWNHHIRDVLEKSRILETEEGAQALKKMETTKQEFESKIGKVDERIAYFEKQKSENPSDKMIDQRLQTLYKLKAVSNVLEEKVTSLQVQER